MSSMISLRWSKYSSLWSFGAYTLLTMTDRFLPTSFTTNSTFKFKFVFLGSTYWMLKEHFWLPEQWLGTTIIIYYWISMFYLCRGTDVLNRTSSVPSAGICYFLVKGQYFNLEFPLYPIMFPNKETVRWRGVKQFILLLLLQCGILEKLVTFLVRKEKIAPANSFPNIRDLNWNILWKKDA